MRKKHHLVFEYSILESLCGLKFSDSNLSSETTEELIELGMMCKNCLRTKKYRKYKFEEMKLKNG